MIPDLDQPQTDKDTTKSCVFGWPDRPPDTLPPDFPPINPPPCYPYCSFDDWPIPVIPVIPPPPAFIPPDTTPHGLGFVSVGANIQIGHFISTAKSFLTATITGLGTIGGYNPVDVNGFPTCFAGLPWTSLCDFGPQYLGGAQTSLDHIAAYNLNMTANFITHGFEVDLVKLLAEFSFVQIFLIDIRINQLQAIPPLPLDQWPFEGQPAAIGENGISVGYSYHTGPSLPVEFVYQYYVDRTSGLYSRGLADGVLIPPNI